MFTKRNNIVLIATALIVLYAYLSERFNHSNENKIDLKNYQLNDSLSQKVKNDIYNLIYPDVDSINIKYYEMKNKVDEKYILAYLKVNKDHFATDSILNTYYFHPFLDGLIKSNMGNYIGDIKFHYNENGKEIIRDEHFELSNTNDGNGKGEECSIMNDGFQREFFPFEFDNYDRKKLEKYFDINVAVDSAKWTNRYITNFYNFNLGTSSIEFNVTSEDHYHAFHINRATIKSNFMKTRNDILIDMLREDFFKKINVNKNSCDVFTIVVKNQMYHFSFENDSLKSIVIEGL